MGKRVLSVLELIKHCNQSNSVGSVGGWVYNPKIFICMGLVIFEEELHGLFSGKAVNYSFLHYFVSFLVVY